MIHIDDDSHLYWSFVLLPLIQHYQTVPSYEKTGRLYCYQEYRIRLAEEATTCHITLTQQSSDPKDQNLSCCNLFMLQNCTTPVWLFPSLYVLKIEQVNWSIFIYSLMQNVLQAMRCKKTNYHLHETPDGREMRNRTGGWRGEWDFPVMATQSTCLMILFAQFTCISEDSIERAIFFFRLCQFLSSLIFFSFRFYIVTRPDLSEIKLNMSSCALMYQAPATWSGIRPSRYRDRYNCHESGYSSHTNEVDPIQNEANIY